MDMKSFTCDDAEGHGYGTVIIFGVHFIVFTSLTLVV